MEVIAALCSCSFLNPFRYQRLDLRTITDICKERIRRVVEKLNEEDTDKLALETKANARSSFRSFKLAESNFKAWNAERAETLQRWSGSSNSTSVTSGKDEQTRTSFTKFFSRVAIHLRRQLKPSHSPARPSTAWRADSFLSVWTAN